MNKIDHRKTRRGIFRVIAEKLSKDLGTPVSPALVNKRFWRGDLDILKRYEDALGVMDRHNSERDEIEQRIFRSN